MTILVPKTQTASGESVLTMNNRCKWVATSPIYALTFAIGIGTWDTCKGNFPLKRNCLAKYPLGSSAPNIADGACVYGKMPTDNAKIATCRTKWKDTCFKAT